jgi:hypothetical protein
VGEGVFRKAKILIILILAVAGGVTAASAFVPHAGGDTLGGPQSVQPDGNGSTLAARTPDPRGGPGWAVQLYRSQTGAICPQAGRISHDGQFGRVDGNGSFVALDVQAAGACTDLEKTSAAIAVNRYPAAGQRPARAVVFGVAAPTVTELVLQTPGGPRGLVIDENGSFIAVSDDPDLLGVSLDVTTQGTTTSYPLQSNSPTDRSSEP